MAHTGGVSFGASSFASTWRGFSVSAGATLGSVVASAMLVMIGTVMEYVLFFLGWKDCDLD